METRSAPASTRQQRVNPATGSDEEGAPRGIASTRAGTPIQAPSGIITPRVPVAASSRLSPGDAAGSVWQPGWDKVKTEGRFNDAHFHPANYTGNQIKFQFLIRTAIELGIRNFTLMQIPTTIRPKDDKAIHKTGGCTTYYLPEEFKDATRLTAEMIKQSKKNSVLELNTEVDMRLLIGIAEELLEKKVEPKHLDMVDPAMTGLNLGSKFMAEDIVVKLRAASVINRLLSKAEGIEMKDSRLRFNHVGEITVTKELVDELNTTQSTWVDLHTNVQGMRDGLRMAGVVGMSATIHCDIGDPLGEDDVSLENLTKNLDALKKLFISCPRTDLIWAHAGGLGRFVYPGLDHVKILNEILGDDNYKHVHFDMSWLTVAKKVIGEIEDETIQVPNLQDWADLINRYPDRFLAGSDSLTPTKTDQWTATQSVYEEHLKPLLTEEAWDQFCFKNYERLFVDARKRVDCFTDHVLPSLAIGDIRGSFDASGGIAPVIQPVNIPKLELDRDKIYRSLLQEGSSAGSHDSNSSLSEKEPNDLRQLFEYLQEKKGEYPETASPGRTVSVLGGAALSRAGGSQRRPSVFGTSAFGSPYVGPRYSPPLQQPPSSPVPLEENPMVALAGQNAWLDEQYRMLQTEIEARDQEIAHITEYYQDQLAIADRQAVHQEAAVFKDQVVAATQSLTFQADALRGENFELRHENNQLYKTLGQVVAENNKLEDKINANKDTTIDRLRKLKTQHKNLAAIRVLQDEIKAAPAKRRMLKSMANLATSVLPGVRTRFPAYRLGSDGTHAPFIEVERRAQIRKLEAEIQRDVNAALENPESLVR